MSNKDPWYRQCTYETETDGGKKVDTSWIPEALAKVGKKIYFGKKTDAPQELWTVTFVGARQRESWVVARRKDHEHIRDVSDV